MGQGTSVMTAKAKASEWNRRAEAHRSVYSRTNAVLPPGGRGKSQYSLPTPGPKEVLRWEEGQQKLLGPFSCISKEGPSFLSPRRSTCGRRCGFCSLS